MDTIVDTKNHSSDDSVVSRRKVLFLALTASFAAAGAMTVLSTEAEARPKWGNPPGWSRGRKMGWRKRGGPRRRRW